MDFAKQYHYIRLDWSPTHRNFLPEDKVTVIWVSFIWGNKNLR
jgi:hypothetical protein